MSLNAGTYSGPGNVGVTPDGSILEVLSAAAMGGLCRAGPACSVVLDCGGIGGVVAGLESAAGSDGDGVEGGRIVLAAGVLTSACGSAAAADAGLAAGCPRGGGPCGGVLGQNAYTSPLKGYAAGWEGYSQPPQEQQESQYGAA